MVTIGCCETDYPLLAILLLLMIVPAIAAMKLDSIPFRLTVIIMNISLAVPLDDYGMMYQIFTILFGMAVLFRTVYDVFDRGAEV